MTTTERAHGTRTKYVHDGCRCLPCRAANANYAMGLARNRAYGRSDLIDAGPVLKHIRELQAAGMGRRTIAAASGVSDTALTKLLGYGRDKPTARVRRATADRLLAVTPELAPSAPIDATGTTRRLQALVAVGWPQSHLAARLGWLGSNLTGLVVGKRPKVLQRTADDVRRLYDELWDAPPPARSAGRARRRAAANGWPPPAAWEDDTIDDPTAKPELGEADPARSRRGGRRIDLAIAAELAELGETDHDIARRFDVTLDALQQARRRALAQAEAEIATPPVRDDEAQAVDLDDLRPREAS